MTRVLSANSFESPTKGPVLSAIFRRMEKPILNLVGVGSHLLLVCVTLSFAQVAAYPQTLQIPVPQGRPSQTWADQQKSQAWAAEKLAKSPRRNEWVKISNGSRTLKAWVVYPEAKAKVPVVLVLHEVFGLTDSTRNTADEIAAMGYIAIAPDMLSGYGPNGGDVSSFPTSHDASETNTSVRNEAVNADLNAWADYGDKLPASNGKFAIVGLSWGGGAAFRYAANTQRKDLKAVCVFYDVGPPTVTQGPTRNAKDNPPVSVTKITVPVYGFYPSEDTRVMSSLQATKEAMAAAGKKYNVVVYDGADHAYMRVGEDPANSNPANPPAVKASLDRLQRVLADNLR
jgi:carboxymethylenebutenolidase